MENGKILVVEDDVGIAALERRRLERAGNTVVTAGTSEEAMVEIKQGGIELIVLDFMLPGGITGLDFHVQMKAAGYDIPVIMVTGLSDEATVIKALRAGVSDFITKSVEYLDYLPEAADRALGQAHTKRRLAESEAKLREAQQQRIEALSSMNAEMQVMNKKLEDAHNQLLQSEKMASVGQLAAGVAHEINNPVGYIYSNIGSLQTYLNDLFKILDAYEQAEPLLVQNDEGVKTLSAITALKNQVDVEFLRKDVTNLVAESREGINRVKQIVQDLKDFSHVDKAEWEWADLHKGIDSTLNIVNNEIKYKAEVIKQYGSLPQVECLPSQINQVFMNLLVNAAHAIEERGTITICTGSLEDWVFIEVVDTGKGIAPGDMKRIFDPFFTTKPVGKGTGLGLSLAYGIIKKHNGRIVVDSEPGQGTKFQVWLPISQKIKTGQPPIKQIESLVM
ncbi:MAG TPA: ATP-binding protein [Gammaproteobacteria bacterium]|nr:ATP-binding protein [Gammaproteobacteria bacterium]